MQNLTAAEIMRNGRGLVASFDPTSGVDRTRAFVADVCRLFDCEPPAAPPVTAALSGSTGSGPAFTPGPMVVGGVDFSEQLSPAKVAEAFAVTTRTVTRWGDTGVLAVIRTPGGHRRFSRAQVKALLAGEQA